MYPNLGTEPNLIYGSKVSVSGGVTFGAALLPRKDSGLLMRHTVDTENIRF